ncbi:hypothetical protein EUX98_g5761 [Antrodiella citrinella]|uniref:Uncharacterized protein n=1 Tax=Antrodiella citrinella TaxID=2447956 RepID=A0A4S4MYF7_9APHY|nr:hypothetical protein EUX98_g5761 [Antrodiella citrinella]
MARATRASAQQEKDNPPESAPQSRKAAASKKRKRTSFPDGDDQPANKHLRTDDDIKEEDASPEPDDGPISTSSSSSLQLPSSGDVPIQSEYAEKILEILEVVDTQGLLDRVFPLPTEQEDTKSSSSSSGPSSSSRTYSFRALLKEPEQHPLRVLRSAVQHLFPISSHPRSRPSATAAEQLRFCNLALSLLDQASLQSAPIPLDVESLIAALSTDTSDEQTSSETPLRKRKYALVQKLSSGDWWTSTNTIFPPVSEDGKEVTDLHTAHADLVAVFPTPSSAGLNHGKTLAAYAQKTTATPDARYLSQPRQVCSGKFLDYGPWASFAPTFDQTGMEIGRTTMGEVIFQQERKRRLRAMQDRVRTKQISVRAAQVRMGQSEISADPSGSASPDVQIIDGPSSDEADSKVDSLEGLLSSDQVAAIKSTLESLELEGAVEELLTRNANALEKLEELQSERLLNKPGPVTTDSEEWETAQIILESLSVLASLRPRLPGDSEHPPLVPTASALRKLHRTLPVGDAGGWYGTLPPARAKALRDDTTVRVKPGVPVPAPAVPVATPAPPAATPVAPRVATPVAPAQQQQQQPGNYSYTYPQPQYRGGYGTYAPTTHSTTSQFYTQAYQQPHQQGSAHYPNAQYNASGQQQYYSAGWYNYQPPASAQASAAGGSSGRGTPQPATTATNPGAYTFYNGSQSQAQRAVANTVLSAGASKPGAWSAAAVAAASPHVAPTLPTLPPHLRGGSAQPAPAAGGAPAAVVGGYPAYYANAQTSSTPLR